MIRISKELKRDSDTFVLRWVISTVILNRVKTLEPYLWVCLQGRFQGELSRWTVHTGCGWIYPVGPGLLNRRKMKTPDECQFPLFPASCASGKRGLSAFCRCCHGTTCYRAFPVQVDCIPFNHEPQYPFFLTCISSQQ